MDGPRFDLPIPQPRPRGPRLYAVTILVEMPRKTASEKQIARLREIEKRVNRVHARATADLDRILRGLETIARASRPP